MQGLPEHLTPELLTKNNSTKAENTMTSQRVFISYRSQEPDVIEAAHAVIPPHINTAPYLENYQSLLQESPLIRINAPDKMGKTRLLNHIFNSFDSNNYRKVLLSMKVFDTQDKADTERLLKRFCQEISNQLNLPNQVEEHWEQGVVNTLKCTSYFENYLLPNAKSSIVLVIDDLNSLTSYNSTCQDFCSVLRAFYNQCATSSEQYYKNWGKLGLIIAYSSAPNLPENQSPFNVGKEIKLPEFTDDQVRSLATQHKIQRNDDIIPQIMKLVGGQPYLIKLFLEHLKETNLNSQEDINEFISQAPTQIGIYSSHLNKLLIKIQDSQLKQGLYRVVSSPDPVYIDPLISAELNGLGLIKYVSYDKICLTRPFCELYRIFFENVLRRS
jgi:hypothetical protein